MTAASTEYALGAQEVQETILILNLSVAQIDLSITEGDHSVNALIDSFTFMAQQIEQIRVASQGVLDVDPDRVEAQHAHALLNTQADELAAKMQQAVVAFQFYDKLSQRLNHVSRGLSGLAEIVSHHMCVKDQQAWQEFKQQIRSGTTMREEEELFELIFDQQVPADEAIEIMRQRMLSRMQAPHSAEEEDEFELF
jgi:hypothetical protein